MLVPLFDVSLAEERHKISTTTATPTDATL